MIDSLKEHSSSKFNIYVICIDEETYDYLHSLGDKIIIPILFRDFESEEIKSIKSDRTFQELCWTCTPWSIKYVLENFKPKSCTYLDADLFFFNDPSKFVLATESRCEVSITPHRFTPIYDQGNKAGIYCVQFLTFSNTSDSIEVLNDWAYKCIDWCYARYEDGKFGDQKYLDEWPQKYKCINIINSPEIGLAPWNIQQYKIDGNFTFNGHKIDPIFYHFHYTRFMNRNRINAGPYDLTYAAKSKFYKSYLKKLVPIKRKCVDQGLEKWKEIQVPKLFSKDYLRYAKSIVKNRKNLLNLNKWQI